jgi:protein phosphatase
MIPRAAKLRVIGDVHGDARAFAHAIATDHFIVQLGDLVDYGAGSAAVLRAMLGVLAAGRGLFLLGNHDLRLARALAGHRLRPDPVLAATLAGLDGDLGTAALAALRRAPAWLRQGTRFFVHAGFHTAMLETPPPGEIPLGAGRIAGLLGRALYGEPTGRMQADGFPERSLRWVDRIPPGLTVYCGHDRRSRDGRPYVLAGAAGGRAVFLDTGAGKGGHLSWIDLAAEETPMDRGRP